MVNYFSAGTPLVSGEDFTPNCWVDMINPTDGEVEKVARQTGIPEDMIKAALDEEEMARTEFDEGCSLFVVDCPVIEEGENGDTYSTLPLAIIYNKNCVATVCLKGNPVLKDFITCRIKVQPSSPVNFILNFLLGNAQRFLYCLKQIDRKSQRVQADLSNNLKNDDILQLLELENSLVYFSTSLNSNSKVHEKLAKAESISSHEDLQDLYDDLVIECNQAIEMCKIYKDTMSVSMDAYGSVISNNANDSMKKLTIITILLAVPTMIAGFWGMNMPVPFDVSSGETWGGWFYIVISIAVLVTVAVAVILFKGKPLPSLKKRARKNNKKKK
ncbi:MAG: magnesium transporter CorA family protein [Clostridia bacterium]|nr:magnesium transporter CorA family protein [Clostridia bacterium]